MRMPLVAAALVTALGCNSLDSPVTPYTIRMQGSVMAADSTPIAQAHVVVSADGLQGVGRTTVAAVYTELDGSYVMDVEILDARWCLGFDVSAYRPGYSTSKADPAVLACDAQCQQMDFTLTAGAADTVVAPVINCGPASQRARPG